MKSNERQPPRLRPVPREEMQLKYFEFCLLQSESATIISLPDILSCATNRLTSHQI